MDKKDHTFMGNDSCPNCNYKTDSASAVNGEHVTPNPHDVSICLSCGEWLEYSDDMALMKISDKVKKELTRQQLVILRDARDFIKKRGLIKK